MHVGMHTGGGVALHVSLFGMHARRASQQNVSGAQRAVAQNDVPTPLSGVPPGQRPRGTQNIPNMLLQHSWSVLHIDVPQRTPVPPSVPVGQKRGSRHAIKPKPLQQISVPVHTLPPHVGPASGGGVEHVPRGAQNCRPPALQHSCALEHTAPPHVPASTNIGHVPRGTHAMRPSPEQHSCIALQVIPPHVPPPPPSITGLHGTLIGKHVGPTGVAQHC